VIDRVSAETPFTKRRRKIVPTQFAVDSFFERAAHK